MIFRSDVFLLLERGDPKPCSILSVIDINGHILERKMGIFGVRSEREMCFLAPLPPPSPRSLARVTACRALARHSLRGSRRLPAKQRKTETTKRRNWKAKGTDDGGRNEPRGLAPLVRRPFSLLMDPAMDPKWGKPIQPSVAFSRSTKRKRSGRVVPALHNHTSYIPFFGNGKLENKEARGRCRGEKNRKSRKIYFFRRFFTRFPRRLSLVSPFSFLF